MKRKHLANFTSGSDNQDRGFLKKSHQPSINKLLLSSGNCTLKFLEQLAGTDCCADLAFGQGEKKEKEEKQCQTLPPSISEQDMVVRQK